MSTYNIIATQGTEEVLKFVSTFGPERYNDDAILLQHQSIEGCNLSTKLLYSNRVNDNYRVINSFTVPLLTYTHRYNNTYVKDDEHSMWMFINPRDTKRAWNKVNNAIINNIMDTSEGKKVFTMKLEKFYNKTLTKTPKKHLYSCLTCNKATIDGVKHRLFENIKDMIYIVNTKNDHYFIFKNGVNIQGINSDPIIPIPGTMNNGHIVNSVKISHFFDGFTPPIIKDEKIEEDSCDLSTFKSLPIPKIELSASKPLVCFTPIPNPRRVTKFPLFPSKDEFMKTYKNEDKVIHIPPPSPTSNIATDLHSQVSVNSIQYTPTPIMYTPTPPPLPTSLPIPINSLKQSYIPTKYSVRNSKSPRKGKSYVSIHRR